MKELGYKREKRKKVMTRERHRIERCSLCAFARMIDIREGKVENTGT